VSLSRTITGHPIADTRNSLTAGVDGPTLLQDFELINKLAHFDRERIPERVVHAKGAGAHGYFEVTKDVSQFTKAAFLNKVGKKTPVFLRFSTVGGEKGSADTARDPRGFAIKHYTEDGNYDMVGNATPIFFIRDAQKFPDFIHTQKKNPQSNLPDPDSFWDFFSLNPETMHQMMFLFSNRGTPYSFRHLHGFSSHTYKWVNTQGEQFWIKLHYKTETGIKNFSNDEAKEMAGKDPDWATRDLFNHIQKGGIAAWKAYVQIMPVAEAANYRFDVFDVTKVWPYEDYPLLEYGRLVLNRNPQNYFAETEQSAFSPANLVPGIEASPDKLLQGRLFSYNDTHRHRLGANYTQIPINAPLRSKLNSYYRDGPMCVNGNGGSGPNYYPNSFGGPTEAPQYKQAPHKVYGTAIRTGRNHPNSDFEQPAMFYNKALQGKEREDLVSNIVGSLGNAKKEIQIRQTKLFYKVDPKFGAAVAEGLGLDKSNF